MKAWDWMHCFKVRIVGFQHKQLKGQRVASKNPSDRLEVWYFKTSSQIDVRAVSIFPPFPAHFPQLDLSFHASPHQDPMALQPGIDPLRPPVQVRDSDFSEVLEVGEAPPVSQVASAARDWTRSQHNTRRECETSGGFIMDILYAHTHIYSIYVYMNYDIYIWLYVIYYTYSNIFIYKMDTIYNFVMARWIACRKMLDVFQYIAIFQRNIWFLWGFSGCEPPEWFQHPPMSCRLGWHMELMQIVTKTHRRHGRKDR